MPTTISGDTGVSAVQNGAVDLTTDVSGVLPVANGGNGTATANASFKNRIINGAMMISQRGTSFSTPSNGSYTIDRWLVGWGGAAPASVSQVAGISGFKNAIQITGAASNTGAFILQRIESSNCSDLSGISVTIQANISVSIAQTVLWQLSYANSSDNFSAVTSIATGTWSATTTATLFNATISNLPASSVNGLQLVFYPNNGSSFTSGTMTVTGVQLEKGSTATSFDYRPYGTELALCQRYCFVYRPSTNYAPYLMAHGINTTSMRGLLKFPQTMRAAPSLTFTAANTFQWSFGNVATSISLAEQGIDMSSVDIGSTGLAANGGYMLTSANNTTSYIIGSSEL